MLRDQLEYLYAPLEILTRMNEMAYNMHFDPNTTDHDRSFIEQRIWHPNHSQIRETVMRNSHLLDEVPEAVLRNL